MCQVLELAQHRRQGCQLVPGQIQLCQILELAQLRWQGCQLVPGQIQLCQVLELAQLGGQGRQLVAGQIQSGQVLELAQLRRQRGQPVPGQVQIAQGGEPPKLAQALPTRLHKTQIQSRHPSLVIGTYPPVRARGVRAAIRLHDIEPPGGGRGPLRVDGPRRRQALQHRLVGGGHGLESGQAGGGRWDSGGGLNSGGGGEGGRRRRRGKGHGGCGYGRGYGRGFGRGPVPRRAAGSRQQAEQQQREGPQGPPPTVGGRGDRHAAAPRQVREQERQLRIVAQGACRGASSESSNLISLHPDLDDSYCWREGAGSDAV